MCISRPFSTLSQPGRSRMWKLHDVARGSADHRPRKRVIRTLSRCCGSSGELPSIGREISSSENLNNSSAVRTFRKRIVCGEVGGSVAVRIDGLPVDLRALEAPSEQYPFLFSLSRAERQHPATIQDPNVVLGVESDPAAQDFRM